MDRDDLGFGHPMASGEVSKIASQVAAITDRDLPEMPWCIFGTSVRKHSVNFIAERLERDRQRIEVDHQGAIGRHQFDDAVGRITPQRRVQPQDSGICRRIDRIAEFDRQGTVADCEVAGRGHWAAATVWHVGRPYSTLCAGSHQEEPP